MPDQNINRLRGLLFASIERLADRDKPVDLDRERAIVEAAQVIVNTAKVEVDFIRATGGDGTGFIDAPDEPAASTLPDGITRITRHRLK
ncbi:MAG: hypothetical protein AB7K86_08455 [Rhodospirillales bacterium]